MSTNCGKNVFDSRAGAKKHAREANKGIVPGGKGRPVALRPYLCDRCGHWHLTSQTKRHQRQVQRRLGKR